MTSFSIIIPAHNEESIIEKTVLGIINVLKNKKMTYEILICNDHSTDNTLNIAKKIFRH